MNAEKCPLCKSDSRSAFTKYNISICDCKICGHRFAAVESNANHIAEIYSDQYFNGGGAGYHSYLNEADILRAAGRRYGKLVKRFTDAKTMVDVGAAAGFVLQGFRDEGWQVNGIEPNATMVQFAREKLDLDVINTSLEDFTCERQFDLVTLIQVIAHFKDPFVALEKVAGLNKSNGFLLVETWRRDSLTAKFFGHYWHEYSPPSVLHWFTKKGLQETIEKFGYRTVASGRPAKWINAAHAKSLLEFKLKEMPLGTIFAKALNVIPSRMNLLYPAEDLFWLLCQKTK